MKTLLRTHPEQALLAPPRQAKLRFAQRAGPALLALGPVRLGHIINALFTLQSTTAAVARGACLATSPNAAPDALGQGGVAQRRCACRPAKQLRRWWR